MVIAFRFLAALSPHFVDVRRSADCSTIDRSSLFQTRPWLVALRQCERCTDYSESRRRGVCCFFCVQPLCFGSNRLSSFYLFPGSCTDGEFARGHATSFACSCRIRSAQFTACETGPSGRSRVCGPDGPPGTRATRKRLRSCRLRGR